MNHTVTPPMPAFWSWLASATFVGARPVRDHGVLDVWSYVGSGINLTLAVSDRDVNTPVFLAREYTGACVHPCCDCD